MTPTLFDREGLVAFGPRGDRSAADLWSAASRIARVLPEGAPSAAVLLVFESDRFLFAASVLAAWSRGLTALVPPDNRRATLTRLQHRPDVSAILHDTESGLEHRVQDVLREPEAIPDLDAFLEALESRWRRRDLPLVVLWGGVAGGAEVETALSGVQLQAEIERLDRALALPPGGRVVGSVPIGHRFGLVHTVLRPLAGGCAFSRGLGPSSALAEELESLRADVLITHPRELARLAQGPRLPLSAIVSSGGRLEPDVARAAAQTFGPGPVDLFSTTSGGALAWRPDPSEPWRCLDGVEVRSGGEGARFRVDGVEVATPDQVEVQAPDRFVDLDRADRSAAGVGVDLDAVEQAAKAVSGVLDAGTTRVERALLVAVATTTSGPIKARVHDAVLAHLGRAGPAEAPASSLDVDVRIAPSLPRDGMGRLPPARLLALFGRGPDGSLRSETIDIPDPEPTVDGFRFELIVPTNYRWFDGHFDQYPVLPAAVQLSELVVPCARRAGLVRGGVARFERLKFSRRIQPGMTIMVSLAPIRGAAIGFEITGEPGSLSSGRLLPAEDGS